jgi:RNA polymerase sigma factor for flagellar operon FliA
MAIHSPSDEPPEKLFLRHLSDIENIARYACRGKHLSVQDTEEFVSSVMEKMIDDDYAVIRKFRGSSKLVTYLQTCVVRHLQDHLNHMWGKWRSSAEAQRLGPAAVELERLFRDGYSFDEACEILRINYHINLSWQELNKIASSLPPRTPRRMEDVQVLEDLPHPGGQADGPVRAQEQGALRRKAFEALRRGLAALPAEDNLIVRMALMDEFTVPQVANVLHLDETKPLYRRIDNIKKRLEKFLIGEGIRRQDLPDILDAGDEDEDEKD